MNTLLNWIILWIITAAAVAITAYLLPGVQVKNFGTALITAVVLGIVNLAVRPFLIIITFPLTILTLGLFTLVINAFMVMLTAAIVPNFKVNGFWNALLFSIIITIVRIIVLELFHI